MYTIYTTRYSTTFGIRTHTQIIHDSPIHEFNIHAHLDEFPLPHPKMQPPKAVSIGMVGKKDREG